MKGIVRGVLALTLAVAAACTNDETVDVGGEFDEVKVDRSAMFVSIGDSSAVLARLVNDLNSSTPTSFTVSNVGAGIQVNYDALYRPDYTNGDSLAAPLVKPQQRYWVVGTAVGLHQFTLTSSGASTTVNVYVTPDSLVGALSASGQVVAGTTLTLTAPSGLRFSDNSAVTFSGGGPAPVITSRAADGSSISFLVGPGVSGQAIVTGVTYLFAPAAPGVTLRTPESITVPAITTVPIAINPAAPTPFQQVTMTATGFKFLPTFSLTIGGLPAQVISRSADSLSAQVILPVTTGPVVVNGVALSFLPGVALTGLTPSAAINFPTTLAYNTSAPDASAPTLTANAPGTPLVFRDSWTNIGGDPWGFGGNTKFYKLVIPVGGSRTFSVGWNSTADLDFAICTNPADGSGCFVAQLTSANPETAVANIPAGTYWIGVALWAGGPQTPPGVVTITIN